MTKAAVLAFVTQAQIAMREAVRRKWFETRKENGAFVEYLMVECEHCHQPWARQHVLRLSEDDFQRWEALEQGKKPSSRWEFYCRLFSLFGKSRLERRISEAEEEQRHTLSRYSSVLLERVGTQDEYQKEYVVLPTETR